MGGRRIDDGMEENVERGKRAGKEKSRTSNNKKRKKVGKWDLVKRKQPQTCMLSKTDITMVLFTSLIPHMYSRWGLLFRLWFSLLGCRRRCEELSIDQ